MSQTAPLHADLPITCPQCGYDLRALTSARCPECGLAIDSQNTSPIPWCHRARIGRLHAFRRTFWMCIFHPGKIGQAVAYPIDPIAARSFGWIIIALASLPLMLAAALFLILSNPPFAWNLNPLYPWGAYGISQNGTLPWEASILIYSGLSFWPIACVAIPFTFALCTAVPSMLFFKSPFHLVKHRAKAICNYGSTGLGLAFVPTILLLCFGLTQWNYPLFGVAAACVTFLILLLWWFDILRIFQKSTHCGIRRLLAVAVLLPFLWLVCALIGLGLFPAVAGLLHIMISSLAS